VHTPVLFRSLFRSLTRTYITKHYHREKLFGVLYFIFFVWSLSTLPKGKRKVSVGKK